MDACKSVLYSGNPASLYFNQQYVRFVAGSRWMRPLVLVALAAMLCGCSARPEQSAGARKDLETDVTVTPEEVAREAERLPPILREKFETPEGRREFAASLVDKKLLVREAHRRGLAEKPEIQRQVRELEERLIVQALLADEERTAGRLS